MPHIASAGYVVASCHVEKPLDDDVWLRYVALLRRRPGGIAVASLLRPPGAGEDEAVWLARAREASALGPVGHHTHWTSAEHARPSAGDTGDRVLREGRWLSEAGIAARFFCGGGWYFDADVARAVADLGYVDCTATAFRPGYLPAGAPRLGLTEPARLLVGDGRELLELPTTHSLGAAARGLPHRGSALVHVYFHDYDLLDRRRRLAVYAVLTALGRLRRPSDLDELAAAVEGDVPEVRLEDALA